VTGGLFENFSVRNPVNVGVQLVANGNYTCSWNTFINLTIETLSGGKTALWLSGTAGNGNACHNTFITTQINIVGSQNGIYVGGCGSNNFYMTYILPIHQ
jgi:hypothetical protein